MMECSTADDDAPIRQGDVFQWNTGTADPFRKLGIVVTADCDIAWDKHHGILSYVPVIELSQYLTTYYLPTHLGSEIEKLTGDLVAQIRKFQKTNLPEFTQEISDDVAISWLDSKFPNEIIEDLKVGEAGDRDELDGLISLRTAAKAALDSCELSDLIGRIVGIRAKRSPKPEGKIREEFSKQIVQHTKQLPGDVFFIGSLGVQLNNGYVACLRPVREIKHNQIAIKQSDLGAELVRARRIARLASPYVYRLSQQLAYVFHAIGLPEKYEHNRQTIAERMTATYFNEK